jgi:two-component SAPR family response regulator
MKTKEIELTLTEIQYLLNVVEDHIETGDYWGDDKKFFQKIQQSVLDKMTKAYDNMDPERRGFDGME